MQGSCIHMSCRYFGGASVELGNARQEAGGRPVSPWTGGGKRLQAALVRRRYLGEEDP